MWNDLDIEEEGFMVGPAPEFRPLVSAPRLSPMYLES